MEEKKQSMYTVVVVVVLAGILFSCVAGALAGGAAGFLVARQQGRVAAERVLEQGLGELPRLRERTPGLWPREEHFPGLVPEGGMPPFRIVPQGFQGALIREVVPDTPAADAGLEVGDIIIALDRTLIDRAHALPDVVGQYEPGDRVTVYFLRAGEKESALVKLAAHPDDPERAYLGVSFEMMPSMGFGSPHD